jgi:hypothetical protein
MVFTGLAAAEECPMGCPKIYAPVCASDGVEYRTFPNACFLNLYNCENPKHSKLSERMFYSSITTSRKALLQIHSLLTISVCLCTHIHRLQLLQCLAMSTEVFPILRGTVEQVFTCWRETLSSEWSRPYVRYLRYDKFGLDTFPLGLEWAHLASWIDCKDNMSRYVTNLLKGGTLGSQYELNICSCLKY